MGVSNLLFHRIVLVCVCAHVCTNTGCSSARGQASLFPLCIELLKCGHYAFLVVELLYLNTFKCHLFL